MPPTYKREDLWSNNLLTDMIVVTTNGYICKDGHLVMGRGAALELTKIYPGIEQKCGYEISKRSKSVHGNIYEYGFIQIADLKDMYSFALGIFQVKYHYKDNANLELIRRSTNDLYDFVMENKYSIKMNFPGIGYGRLDSQDIVPILEILPNCVTICYR